MKTYNIIKGIFAATVLSVVFSGCSEDAMDRINKDHGHTQSVAGRFILTDVITSTAFSNAGGDFNTYLSAYIEYEVGVDNQLYYAETRESEPTSSSTFNNTWNGLYSTLKSARIIINQLQSPNQKIPDRKTKCVIKTHINIKQNVIFGAKLKPV